MLYSNKRILDMRHPEKRKITIKGLMMVERKDCHWSFLFIKSKNERRENANEKGKEKASNN